MKTPRTALFALGLATFIVAASASFSAESAPVLTAQQVIERLQKQTGLNWAGPTNDTVKAGDPNIPVKGIAVVMMSTYDVLQRAADAGANLIITHEPTFFSGQDNKAPLETENDAVYLAKQELIKKRGLIIFRFHDYLHRMSPDPVLVGFTRMLGWQKYQVAPATPKFVLPETTLEDLAAQIQAKFGIRTLRFVGDAKRKFTKVGFSPGASGFGAHRRLLQDDDVEVLVFGEGTEWETMEYASDAAAQGKPKALILMGHIPSEEPGMRECTTWLKTFIPEVPIQFIGTPEPFWSPK